MAREVEYSATTNGDGHFSLSAKIDPSPVEELGLLLSGGSVSLAAKLVEPDGIVVHGTLEIAAEDGSTSNAKREFKVASKEEKSLGSWEISPGVNMVEVHGRTQPTVASDTVRFRVRFGG